MPLINEFNFIIHFIKLGSDLPYHILMLGVMLLYGRQGINVAEEY